ncbi:MAG TPA: glycosyltransferase family 4 protein, partial [Candidatus Xenobia bacterium]
MSNQSGSAPQPQESAFEAAEAAAVRIGLFYHRMAGIGGVENYLLWTARGLRARHHEVTVACVEAVDALRAHYRDAGFDLAGMDALRGLDVVNVHNSPGWLDYLHLADAPPALLSIHEPPRDVYERDMDAHFLRSPINRERRPWTIWWDAMMRHSARREDQAAVRGYRRIVTDSDYIAGKVREIYGRGDATKLPFGLEEGPLQSDQASL